MSTFISLLNWTDQGVRTFQESVKRANAVSEAAERLGGSLQSVYWTVGQYDLVTITEFPDDETATSFLLMLSSQGNVRTQTLRAYNGDEMTSIIGKAT